MGQELESEMKENLEEKIGECLGLERAAQKAVEEHAEETVQKATEIMKTYLGDEPEKVDALEFLCLAEGGEVTHYEVLSELAEEVGNAKFTRGVNDILKEEKQHLQLCTRLARQAAKE